eukprot:5507008-Pyramimonas_sp.AAC.1
MFLACAIVRRSLSEPPAYEMIAPHANSRPPHLGGARCAAPMQIAAHPHLGGTRCAASNRDHRPGLMQLKI